MHWCADETFALLALLPFVGIYFYRLHAWYHKKFNHKCHTHNCNEHHIEHIDYKSPVVSSISFDQISDIDLEERRGKEITQSLLSTFPNLELNKFLDTDKVKWYISDHQDVMAFCQDRWFYYTHPIWNEIKE